MKGRGVWERGLELSRCCRQREEEAGGVECEKAGRLGSEGRTFGQIMLWILLPIDSK